MNIRCLIVDDEPIARQIIENYSALLPELTVVGSCGSALEARRIIDGKTVDLIFLDINMPVLDGMSFVKTLSHPPVVIFTTAYKEYAHEAFDIAACDYLLKPFSFDRFLVAIDRAKEKLQPNHKVLSASATENLTYLKAEGKIYKINFSEVLYAEASGNNVKIVTQGGVITPAITFTAFEEILPVTTFVRIHRSFIVNKEKIDRIEGNRVFMGDIELPVGASYREFFLRTLGMK